VGFFLTAAFLGMMYYFVPKQAGRPIYSYRLSNLPMTLVLALIVFAWLTFVSVLIGSLIG
jgi:cytochrome c oxidase cbb3-type subunit I